MKKYFQNHEYKYVILFLGVFYYSLSYISFLTFGLRVLIKIKLSLVFKVFSRKVPIIVYNEFH